MHFLIKSIIVALYGVKVHILVLSHFLSARTQWSPNQIHSDQFHLNCNANKWKMAFSVSMVSDLGRASTFKGGVCVGVQFRVKQGSIYSEPWNTLNWTHTHFHLNHFEMSLETSVRIKNLKNQCFNNYFCFVKSHLLTLSWVIYSQQLIFKFRDPLKTWLVKKMFADCFKVNILFKVQFASMDYNSVQVLYCNTTLWCFNEKLVSLFSI